MLTFTQVIALLLFTSHSAAFSAVFSVPARMLLQHTGLFFLIMSCYMSISRTTVDCVTVLNHRFFFYLAVIQSCAVHDKSL